MITINIQDKREIKRRKIELVRMVKSKGDLQSKKVINKSQELDEKIVSLMKWKLKKWKAK